MAKLNKIFLYSSSLFLIVVNVVPIFGVLYLGWDVFTIIILYWLESAVIGFFNVLKMQKINNFNFTRLVPFFIVHYSIFMLAHLFLITQLFKPNLGSASEQVEAFAIVLKYFEGLAISLSLLFLSHGWSFMFNFIKQQEYKDKDLKKQMFVPYQRIVIMQVVILMVGSGTVYSGYDQNVSAIVFLVILKTIFDLGAHIFEHRKNIFV